MTCPSTPSETAVKYKCAAGSVISASTSDAIKQEIFSNGPMETAFDVYEDFFNYEDGIYTHVSGAYAGGHAVKMLGWGIENGVAYWLCANSWGPSWGQLGGFFKIAAGQCGVDSQLFACTPDLNMA